MIEVLSRVQCGKTRNSSPYCTVWKLRKFTVTLFWQRFRESNGFTREITK